MGWPDPAAAATTPTSASIAPCASNQWLGWAGGFVGELASTAHGNRAGSGIHARPPGRPEWVSSRLFFDAFTDTYAHTGVQRWRAAWCERAAR